MILPISGLSVFVTQRPRDHILRGTSQSISQLSLLVAFSLMPLAGAVAINFSSPLFAALVSIVWLKERAGLVRGGALVIGFLGVLIVTNPGANSLTIGALFALINAIMYGTVTIAVRGMTRTESANTLVIWQLSVLAFFHSFLLFFGWRWPTPLDAAMLFGTGFTNAVGQWFWTKSLHLAPAAAVTPFYYLMLVWSLIIGFLVWGDVPTVSLLVGSAKEEDTWAPVKTLVRELTRRHIAQIWLNQANEIGKSFGDKTREWEMDTVVKLSRPIGEDGEDLRSRRGRDVARIGARRAEGRFCRGARASAERKIRIIDPYKSDILRSHADSGKKRPASLGPLRALV